MFIHRDDDYGTQAMFDDATKATLPPDGQTAVPFDAIIYDRETGRSHNVKQDWAAYEDTEFWDGSQMRSGWQLHFYFYAEHWCGCHRITSIEDSNPDVTIEHPEGVEEYCPSDRFYVTSMTHPSHPGVVLYSEKVPAAVGP